MDSSFHDRLAVQAMRLGVSPADLLRLSIPVTLPAETLVLKSSSAPAPLVICLHPGRLCEFQCAQRLRDLVRLRAHIAFPRGLHPQEVDLGGARTVGYGWYHYTGDNPAFRSSIAAAAEYIERVLDRLFAELPVRREAVFLVGAEETSLLSVVLAMRRPSAIAGAVLFDGSLPSEVLADLAPEARTTEFLRVRRSMRWPVQRPPADRGADELRRLGYPVELHLLETSDTRWHEESELLIEWLAEKLGIQLEEPRPRSHDQPFASP
ncbi:MAG: hypothetical protein KA123_01180 [Candidatus Eisenbacteria bacterium]|nr:hypothetical protein [Candidatus Eisenbacteria bacterium]